MSDFLSVKLAKDEREFLSVLGNGHAGTGLRMLVAQAMGKDVAQVSRKSIKNEGRNKAIALAAKSGAQKVADLAENLGLSRARIYQIAKESEHES